MPRLVACGGRGSAYERFRTQHGNATEGDFVALLIDSEEPIYNIDETWTHLREQDGWEKPNGAEDNQVLRMTTSMETWIIADQEVLAKHFGPGFFENSGLPMLDLEQRSRKGSTQGIGRGFQKLPCSIQERGNVFRSPREAHAAGVAEAPSQFPKGVDDTRTQALNWGGCVRVVFWCLRAFEMGQSGPIQLKMQA